MIYYLFIQEIDVLFYIISRWVNLYILADKYIWLIEYNILPYIILTIKQLWHATLIHHMASVS